MELNMLWAKTEPFQSVLTHGIVSGIIAQVLVREILSKGTREQLQAITGRPEKESIDFVGYLVSLHDIGKIDPFFQRRDNTMKQRLQENGLDEVPIGEQTNLRHEQTGMWAVKRIWKTAKVDKIFRNMCGNIIKAHHQGKTGKGRKQLPPEWIALQNQFEREMQNFFLGQGAKELPKVEEKAETLSAVLLGILILSDWIASGSTFADAESWITQGNARESVTERVMKFFRAEGFFPQDTEWGRSFCDVWPNIPRDGMRSLQRETESLFLEGEERISLLLLEAPMGEGKTEAGMYGAMQMMEQWGKNGFYLALPTSATANQMVGRMRDLLRLHQTEDQVRLLHAMAWLVDREPKESNSEDEKKEILRWLAPLRRGLLSPYAVGTVDQAMLAAAQVRYGVLRLLGLANKVLVIDEIHSYDVYMSEFIIRLLEWCRALEIPVVMLSATLPPETKRKMLHPYGYETTEQEKNAYPVITAITEHGNTIVRSIPSTARRAEVQIALYPMLNHPAEIAKLAADRGKEGGCLCVLLNTVREAQAVYQELAKLYPGELLLFHAQFPAERREEIERECLKKYGKDKTCRPKQSILVATQVVEQSLDVDFDAMITAVAPIDLLIQRMGRVFRHDESPRPAHLGKPSLWVLIPEEGEDFGSTQAVYPACLLRQSVYLLSQRETVRIPEDIAALVADGYDSGKAPPEERYSWLEQGIEDMVKAASSEAYLLSHPEKEFSPLWRVMDFDDMQEDSYLSVQTRLGEPTVRIALLEEEMYRQVEKMVVNKHNKRYTKDKKAAQDVLKHSVSVVRRRLSAVGADSRVLEGDGLLANVTIYPAKNGLFVSEGGGRIQFDPELGVLID